MIVDGGFEGASVWSFGATPRRGGYVTTPVHGGLKSARLGVLPATGDAYSYSTVYQQIVLPAGAGRITLRYWYWPGSQDSAADSQLALILDTRYRSIGRVMQVLQNNQAWRAVASDLTRFAGQSVVIYFNVLNDGDGQRSWMYVDDVSVEVCP